MLKIDKVFYVYGTSELVDAFTRSKKIDYICPFHEYTGSPSFNKSYIL